MLAEGARKWKLKKKKRDLCKSLFVPVKAAALPLSLHDPPPTPPPPRSPTNSPTSEKKKTAPN